jgi:release factor glutamine methyltransferase
MGEIAFGELKLLAAPGRVMTPRATSVQLVTAARGLIGGAPARVVDVGTGSGAIAIAVATACGSAEVWATDTSPAAVALARDNVRRLGLQGRVHVRKGDLLAPVSGRFDLIAANLPYLPAYLAPDRPELRAEPFDAVFAPGDGLDPCRRLVDAAAHRLTERGVLLLQLDGRLVAADRDELPVLRAALAIASPPHEGAGFESVAGKAA